MQKILFSIFRAIASLYGASVQTRMVRLPQDILLVSAQKLSLKIYKLTLSIMEKVPTALCDAQSCWTGPACAIELIFLDRELLWSTLTVVLKFRFCKNSVAGSWS